MQMAGQNANSTKLSAKKTLGNPQTQILWSMIFLLNIPADIDADGNGAYLCDSTHCTWKWSMLQILLRHHLVL